MKYLKTYENLNSPQVGDYIKVDSSKFTELKDFFDIEIGKILRINEKELKIGGYPYYVKFNINIPGSTYGPNGGNEMGFRESEFISWGNSLEDLELKVKANKYNL